MLSESEMFYAAKKSAPKRISSSVKKAPQMYNISLVNNTVAEVAQRSWESLFEENQNRADFLYGYAMYLKSTKEYRRALLNLDRALKIDPNYALGYFLKGDIYRELGNYKEAVLAYVATVKINPHCTDAYFNIAKMFEEYDQIELALDYYRFAYMTNPKDIEIRDSIIRLKRQLALTQLQRI